MKANQFLALALFLSSAVLFGCDKDISMTQAEIDAIKHHPPMTAAQRKAMGEAMAKGGEAAKNQEQAWASTHVDLLPAVNKSRAKRGLAPLVP